MAHSIERRPAFLDHRLTEYVDHLPPSAKIAVDGADEIVESYILREAARRSITASSTSGPNTHISPRSSAASGPEPRVNGLLSRRVTSDNFVKLGCLDADYGWSCWSWHSKRARWMRFDRLDGLAELGGAA
jgi:asparagine synthase (glutamine-hydrolysing)